MSTVFQTPVTQLTNLVTGPAAVVNLTPSQLLNLQNAPVQLIPAQGPNTIIIVNNTYYKYTFKGVDYNDNGAVFQSVMNGVDIELVDVPADGLLNTGVDTIFIGNFQFDDEFTNDFNTLVNQPLMLNLNGGPLLSVPPGSNGLLQIGIFYSVLNFGSTI
jgi:hypothetical protein